MLEYVKTQWCEALRSGLWAEGRDFLCDVTSNTYSPLGVLCELAVQQGVVLSVEEQSVGDMMFRVYDGASITLPVSVKNWSMLRGVNPRVSCGRLYELTANGSNFQRIADLIEAEL